MWTQISARRSKRESGQAQRVKADSAGRVGARLEQEELMTGLLVGKVAVVSGGARGMGASHVRALVDEGAKGVFGDILDAEGEAVAKDVGSASRYVHLDVTQPDDWELVVATAVEAF